MSSGVCRALPISGPTQTHARSPEGAKSTASDRQGELLGLQRGRVDLQSATIDPGWQLQAVRGYSDGSTTAGSTPAWEWVRAGASSSKHSHSALTRHADHLT
jgi:hypothetical protein